MEYLNILKQDFELHKNNYDFFFKQSEEESKKTIISKGFWFDMRPFENEIAGFKKGKECKSIPQSAKDIFVYHINNKEQIIMIEKYGQFSNIIDREFFIYEDKTLKSYYFSSGGNNLRNIKLSIFDGVRTINVYNYGKYGINIENYIYEDKLLKKIQIKSKEFGNVDFSNSELIFEYADNQELEKITKVFSAGKTKELFPNLK
jgi:hypothetical protein